MNKVILLGNLCRNIEPRYTTSDKKVVKNVLGVRDDYKDKDGNYTSQFINVCFWGRNADFIEKYASVGSQLLVEGRLEVRKYEKDNETKYISEVVVEKVKILNKKKTTDNETQTEETPVEKEEKDPFAEMGKQVEMDTSDLPW